MQKFFARNLPITKQVAVLPVCVALFILVLLQWVAPFESKKVFSAGGVRVQIPGTTLPGYSVLFTYTNDNPADPFMSDIQASVLQQGFIPPYRAERLVCMCCAMHPC